MSIHLGEGRESAFDLGREREVFSLLFAQEWGTEAAGLEGAEDMGPEPSQHPPAGPSLCAQQRGCFPTRIRTERDGRGSCKDKRMSSQTVPPASLPGY